MTPHRPRLLAFNFLGDALRRVGVAISAYDGRNSGYASSFEAEIAHDPFLGGLRANVAYICESCLHVVYLYIQCIMYVPQSLPS